MHRQIIDLNKGKKIVVNGYENADLIPIGCNIYCSNLGGEGCCFTNADFENLTGYDYLWKNYKFFNDKCAVMRKDGGFDIINTKGEVTGALELDTDKYEIKSVLGTSFILQDKESELYSVYIAPNNKISAGDTYYYDLINTEGKPVIKNLIGDYYYMYTALADGGGVYCGRKSDFELVTFDKYGNIIGSVKTNQDVEIKDFMFINGLLYVERENGSAYYTPDGRFSITNVNKQKNDKN